jgi:hypothetical protein
VRKAALFAAFSIMEKTLDQALQESHAKFSLENVTTVLRCTNTPQVVLTDWSDTLTYQ